jgi:hypothetical protein
MAGKEGETMPDQQIQHVTDAGYSVSLEEMNPATTADPLLETH